MLYKRIVYKKNGSEGYRYIKGGMFLAEARVPQEVMEKFELVDEYEYADQPDKPRCLFCEAPRTHQRWLAGLMVDLCDHHYYSENIGRIAAELRLQKGKADVQEEKSQRGEAKRNQKRPQRQSTR